MNMPAKNRKHRQKDAPFYIWGIHPVSELLRCHPEQILEIFILQQPLNQRLLEVRERAVSAGITVTYPQKPSKGIDQRHQGVAARIRPPQNVSLTTILEARENPFLLALDCLQDPHNLGSIIRSAAGAGVDALIIPKDRSAPLSGTVYKVSAGTLASTAICQVTNLSSALQFLKKQGVWIFGAEGRAEKNIYEVDYSVPVCLVMGGEEKGIRPLVVKQCDTFVSIPMQRDIDSLNVAVSTAIILFEMARQRR